MNPRRGSLVWEAPDRDRSLWRADEITEAFSLLDSAAFTGRVTLRAASYAVQAGIAAEHARAATAADTDWERIVARYDRLLTLTPTPGIQLARAVALAEARGPEAGLAATAGLDDHLPRSHRLPDVRGELLHRSGHDDEARAAYDLAIERCGNDAEARLLEERRSRLA